MDCYIVFSLLQAYFLPTHGNGEVPVLGKLPYQKGNASQILLQCFVGRSF
jgi:hypothetical protein